MDLEKIITTYQPSAEAMAVVQQAKIVLLAGITSAGKDTIKGKLLQQPDFQDIVSHTTRLPRANNGVDEVNGLDYHFIDANTAIAMAQNSEFIEVKFVHGTVYGTSINEVKQAYDATKIAITDVDVQGVDEYKRISNNVIAIFILPPNYETWLERMRKRYATAQEFDQEFPKRRQSAINELQHALEVSYYHFIINDDLDQSVRTAIEIAHHPDVSGRSDHEARQLAQNLLDAIVAHG